MTSYPTASDRARGRRIEIDNAIDELADLIPDGHLLAAFSPAELLRQAASEIKRLRIIAAAEAAKGEQA